MGEAKKGGGKKTKKKSNDEESTEHNDKDAIERTKEATRMRSHRSAVGPRTRLLTSSTTLSRDGGFTFCAFVAKSVITHGF